MFTQCGFKKRNPKCFIEHFYFIIFIFCSAQGEIQSLRSEVAQLKALLLAHKDCPVTQQQKALVNQIANAGLKFFVDQ